VKASGPGGSRAGHWLAIVLLTITAVFLIRAVRLGDPGLHVPPSIAYVTAVVLLLGAVAVLQQIIGGPTKGHGVAVLILAGFTVIGGWIALSPDSGGCSIGVNGAPGTAASGLACRIPFGIGAVISGVMTVYAAVSWVRARRGRTVR
jgi:hypothetical protein